jgi:hypothetical protein
MQMGQTLGQFAQASPAVVLVMLKSLERAFSEDFAITDEEWAMLVGGVEQAVQGQQRPPPQQGGQSQQAPQGQGGGPEEMLGQVEQILQKLPPEAQQAIGGAIAQGVPLREIMSKAMGMSNGATPPPQQQN